MRIIPICLFAPLLACACATAVEAEPENMVVESAIKFTANSGEEIDAFEGAISVPENRAAAQSRDIKLGYVRFPSTSDDPGAPIIYLAGGPGGSGIQTAKGRRFPLFMAMREFGDVIALDQRGVGVSDDTQPCRSSVLIPATEATTDAERNALYRQSADECAGIWRSQGVDPAGYTTAQSVDDLEALRIALGAEKITLWGISYGSHLTFAALARMDDRIDRVVIASAEGLDQTVKLPARTDAYFDRLQAVVDADAATKATYPDIKAMMRRVHGRLEAEPVMLNLPRQDADPAPYLLQKFGMQQIASALISDPERAAMLLALYAAADAGEYAPIAQILARFIEPEEPVSWRVMPLAMDLASGISDERLSIVEQQAKTSLLGDHLNFPMPHIRGALGGLDLGEEFREGPISDVPTLLFTGTLDGRTYPEGQLEAVAGLKNLTAVTVVHAGHNLFMTSPEVTEVIQTFMRGDEVTTDKIVLPAPSLLNN